MQVLISSWTVALKFQDDVLAEFVAIRSKPYYLYDVSDGADAKRMIEEAIAALGSVDVLVNNAGITRDKIMLKMTEEDLEQVLGSIWLSFQYDASCLETTTKARQLVINLSCCRFDW